MKTFSLAFDFVRFAEHKSREVFCELSVEEISEEKRFSFKIYHKTKPIQLIYEFPIDESQFQTSFSVSSFCFLQILDVFVTQKANRELVFNHQIGAEFVRHSAPMKNSSHCFFFFQLETEKKELSQWIKVFPVFETSLKIPGERKTHFVFSGSTDCVFFSFAQKFTVIRCLRRRVSKHRFKSRRPIGFSSRSTIIEKLRRTVPKSNSIEAI